jgi:hypothetical protein
MSDDWVGYFGFNFDVQAGDHSAWWVFWGEERPVIPRLIYWIDFRFFGAKFIFTIISALLMAALLCALLIAIVRERIEPPWSTAASCICVALTFADMHGPALWRSFTAPPWQASALFTLSSFYFLHRSGTGLGWFIAALASALAAILTFVNGLFVLPLMAMMSGLIGLGWRRTALIAALGVCAFPIYLHGYLAENSSPITTIAQQPVFSLAY